MTMVSKVYAQVTLKIRSSMVTICLTVFETRMVFFIIIMEKNILQKNSTRQITLHSRV